MQASDPSLPPSRKLQSLISSPVEASLLSASNYFIPNSSFSPSEFNALPVHAEGKSSDQIPIPSAASVLEEDVEDGEGEDVSDDGNGGRASRTSKRKEKFGMRKACERCRQRKNKCDGNFPCSMCVKSFQEIQAAGGICLFSCPAEMCVRNARKPMSRTSSRHSNESKNSRRNTKNIDDGMVFLPVDHSLMMSEGEGLRRSISDQVGHRLIAMRSSVDQPHAHDMHMHMDMNQKWISHEDNANLEGGGIAGAEDSDVEGWTAGGIFQGPSVPRTQGFFIDEWTVSPARSADQMQLFHMQAQQTTETYISEPQKQPPSQPMIIDGIVYRTFHELSWLALELCEPLSSISLLFWRSLHQIDVPQWLSTRCLLSCCNIRSDTILAGSTEAGSVAPHGRRDATITADHHKLLQLAIITHGCSSGEGEQVAISRDALILLDSMIVRLVKKVLLSAKAAARGDVGPSTISPHASIGLSGAGGTFVTNPPPDFTLVTAISVFISLCCAIGCVSAFSTTPDEDYDAIMSTLSALCNRYSISLGSIRSTFPYLSNVTDINLQYAFGEEIMQNLMQGSAHLLQADSLVTQLFCCDSFVLRLLARATCFKFLERFHSHTPFLPNDPPCMDPVHIFEGINKAADADAEGRLREREKKFGVVNGIGSLSGDYSLAMLFGARHCVSRQLSLSQALGLNTGPAPPAFDLAAAGQHMEAIERIKKYFYTFRSIRQQKGAGNRSAATFFWFKWSLDAVSAVMLYKADATSQHSTYDSPSRKNESNRDAALLLSLSSLVQEVVGLRQSMLFLMEPSAAAALTVIITIVMTQRARSPAYEEIWKSLSMAVSSAAASSVSATFSFILCFLFFVGLALI